MSRLLRLLRLPLDSLLVREPPAARVRPLHPIVLVVLHLDVGVVHAVVPLDAAEVRPGQLDVRVVPCGVDGLAYDREVRRGPFPLRLRPPELREARAAQDRPARWPRRRIFPRLTRRPLRLIPRVSRVLAGKVPPSAVVLAAGTTTPPAGAPAPAPPHEPRPPHLLHGVRGVLLAAPVRVLVPLVRQEGRGRGLVVGTRDQGA